VVQQDVSNLTVGEENRQHWGDPHDRRRGKGTTEKVGGSSKVEVKEELILEEDAWSKRLGK
jgi:hypothetical protein